MGTEETVKNGISAGRTVTNARFSTKRNTKKARFSAANILTDNTTVSDVSNGKDVGIKRIKSLFSSSVNKFLTFDSLFEGFGMSDDMTINRKVDQSPRAVGNLPLLDDIIVDFKK